MGTCWLSNWYQFPKTVARIVARTNLHKLPHLDLCFWTLNRACVRRPSKFKRSCLCAHPAQHFAQRDPSGIFPVLSACVPACMMVNLSSAYPCCPRGLRQRFANHIPCLAGNLNLARVCRNLNSWGCRVGCAIPDGMVTDVHLSVGDAQHCSRPQKCKCV